MLPVTELRAKVRKEKWSKKKERKEKKKMKSTSCDVSRVLLHCSLYLVWADVDAIYQVLKQAGEIRGNSTNSPPTPPTADHPPAPSSARASSHPCSSSTSGKAQHRFLITLKQNATYIISEEYDSTVLEIVTGVLFRCILQCKENCWLIALVIEATLRSKF